MTRRSNSPAASGAESRAVIIVARAGRQLAAAARAAGWQPLVADGFGDADTRALAVEYEPLPLGPQLDFRPRGLLAAVARLRALAPGAPLVWGSGFEGQPQLLQTIAGHGPLLGSPPAALALLNAPAAWSHLLRKLAIPHPAIAKGERARRGAWVAKRSGQSGGAHVRFLSRGGALLAGEYAQRLVPGRALSAVFLATAREVLVTGYSEQRFAPAPTSPFRHAGSITLSAHGLPRKIREEVQQALERLARALDLRGLCGIDFVLQPEGRWQLIELNARPPSSFDLHVSARQMFAAHVAACRGEALPRLRPRTQCHARVVYFASSALRIPNWIDWPDWVVDQPKPNDSVRAGAPVCTVQASGANVRQTHDRLQRRLDRLRGWLGDADRGLPLSSTEILAGEHTHE